MRIVRRLRLSMLALTLALPTAGVAQTNSTATAHLGLAATAQVRTRSGVVRLKKTVAFMTERCRDASGETGNQSGTVFFMAVEDRITTARPRYYIVTNRHMIESEKFPCPEKSFSLFLNEKGADWDHPGRAVTVDLPASATWQFSPDPSVDLAILPTNLTLDHYDIEPFPASLLATTDIMRSQTIAEGDTVLFSGLFTNFPGAERIQPIIRQGVLAMIPDEPLQTTLKKNGRLFLADIHAFLGNSGSPMFVSMTGFRRGPTAPDGVTYRLIGIISGYMEEDTDFTFKPTVDTRLVQRKPRQMKGTLPANSGIATVVPADELKKLIEVAELRGQALR